MSLSASWTRAAVIVITAMSPACVRHLSPKRTPDAIAPKIATQGPPQEGYGRLVIDIDGPSAPIQIVQMAPQQVADAQGRQRVKFVETPQLLCSGTPCVTDPQLGNVLLGFPVVGNPDALEVELVHVGPEPSVYRRSLSEWHRTKKGGGYVAGILETTLGGMAATTGVVLLPIGLADDSDGMTIAGSISLGVGAIVLTVGILTLRAYSDSYQPGSAVHFPM